jgi:uncharacterized cupin superfamily protein
MSNSIVIAAAATSDLNAAPIARDWILDGSPETRNKEIAKSSDQTSYIMVWDCTAGRFNWHYSMDETLVVTSGEAFISDQNSGERRIGPGDIVFFPAGTSATWHVPTYIRKVAFLRQTMPRPMGYGVRAWNMLLRMVRGLDGKRVLDLAYGFGFYTQVLKQQGIAQVLGVDIWPEYLTSFI